MKKILVTGGAGYIGSHTVIELINSGYDPVIVDNFSNSSDKVITNLEKISGKKIKYYNSDCCNYLQMKELFKLEKNIHSVIHFAAYKAVGESVSFPLKYYHNNVSGLINLLNVLQEEGISNFVFSSSCTVYGQPNQLPVNECSPRAAVESPYGNTKKICEDIIEDCKGPLKLKAITLRYFNPVGAHPSGLIGELPKGIPNNLVPYITQTAAGLRDSLTVFGNDYQTLDGSCIRDYIHVVDLAKAHVKSLEYIEKQSQISFNEIFNIGTGKGNSVLELVNTFQEVTGVRLNYKIGNRRPGDIEQIWSEVKKANEILGWTTEYSLSDALLHAWNWQKKLPTIQ